MNYKYPLKLSIIIPVFNVEYFVEKCLRSCLEQNIPSSDYEIIIINDGSTDRSLEIVMQVAKDYRNIKIFSQENKGLSAARNMGLNLSSGEYVWFIDSDDWIATDSLKMLTGLLKNTSPDGLIICPANVYNGITTRRLNFSYIKQKSISGMDFLKKNYTIHCVPFTIYKRSFLLENNLKFMEGIFHEDSEFTPRSYYFARQITILNEVIYFVNINHLSITRTINQKKAFDSIKVAISLSNFSKNVPVKSAYIFDNIISMMINNSLHNIFQIERESIGRLNKYLHENKSLFSHLKRSTVIKYKLEGILFSILPGHCVSIYKLIQRFNRNRGN